MTQSKNQVRRSEGGFTLVELAIVMIIIGLLIGGILKGQELITNARISATVAQTKAVESGISGFRDKYAGIPGDIATPTTRVPSCTGTLCILAGNADGSISVSGAATFDPGAAITATSESAASFVQLGAAGFVGGVSGAATALAAGSSNPTAPLGGAWVLGSSTAGTGTGLTGAVATATMLSSGTYMALTSAPGVAVSATTGPLTPVQAASIDRKVDDGNPNSGIVRATGSVGTGATNCADLATNVGVYNESQPSANCGLFVKVM